jgi:hypothetical protein
LPSLSSGSSSDRLMRPTGSASVVMPPGTLGIHQAVELQSHYWQRRREEHQIA